MLEFFDAARHSCHRITYIVFRDGFMFEGKLQNSAFDRPWGGGNTAERRKSLVRPGMFGLPHAHTSNLFTVQTKPWDMRLGSMQCRKQYGMKEPDARRP